MIIADTNVLLRVVLEDDPVQFELARECLGNARRIVVPLEVICEMVWVLSRRYRLKMENICLSLMDLVSDERVHCDREAINAAIAFVRAGGDFADGMVEYQGRRLGGQTFVTFDRKAASLIRRLGRESRLLAAV